MLTPEKLEEILAAFAVNLTTAIAEDLEQEAADSHMDSASRSALTDMAHVMRYRIDHAYIAKQTIAEVTA